MRHTTVIALAFAGFSNYSGGVHHAKTAPRFEPVEGFKPLQDQQTERRASVSPPTSMSCRI
jgi:hypothetical protein